MENPLVARCHEINLEKDSEALVPDQLTLEISKTLKLPLISSQLRLFKGIPGTRAPS